MFCSNCGRSIEAEQVFCVSCGQRLNAQSKAASASIHQPSLPRVDLDAENAPKQMSFIETIKFSYKNYARFSGRAARSEYWYWVLFVWVGLIVSAMFIEKSIFFLLVYFVFVFSVIIPGIARGVRRLHDINKSGAFLFIGLIPVVGAILLLVWFCTKGDSVPNIYGPALSEGVTSTKLIAFGSEAPSNQSLTEGYDTIRPKAKTKLFIVKNKVLIFTTTLVVLLLGVLQSHVQYGNLIGAIEISEQQMNEYNEKIAKSWEANSSGTPRLFNSNESKFLFETDFKYLSGLYESRVRNAGETTKGIILLPWNFQIQTDKSNYLAHNSVWQKHLANGKIDAFTDLYDKDISSTWLNFCQEINSGMPWYAFGRFDARVAKICISDSDAGSTN